MFWWILLGVSVVTTIMGIMFWIFGKKIKNGCWASEEYGRLKITGVFLTAVCGVCAFMLGLIVLLCWADNKQRIATFIKQKEYFETVVSTFEDGENYTLTQKKIELNEWLYTAQYKKQKYPFFSLCPDEVLELEEIR